MFNRDAIVEILKQAKSIDSQYELFGTRKHKYQLNLPIRVSFVRSLEEKYGFTLPEFGILKSYVPGGEILFLAEGLLIKTAIMNHQTS